LFFQINPSKIHTDLFYKRNGDEFQLRKENFMSVARKTRIISSSKESFHDALNQAVSRSSKTLRGITGLEVTEQKAKVENGKILEYRVECLITFVLEE
jgi:flavin-binding protein dodecin